MKININIFPPHSPEQKTIMEFLANPNPFPHTLWAPCGTKFGKTISAAGGMCYSVPKSRGLVGRIVAPIYKQTRMSWKYCSNILPPKPYVERNKSDMMMLIPSLQSEIQFWHGQSPEDLEGEGVHKQINDECSKLKAQVLISSKTTQTLTRGKTINCSTPRGRNHFYQGCQRAMEEMEAAKRENRIPREIFITAPTSANPYVPNESIVEAQRLLPERLFRQYYLAEFIGDGATFPQLVIDSSQWSQPYEPSGPVQWWIHPNASQLSIVAGCDWAKRQDYTVLTVWDFSKKPFKQVGFLRFHHKRYTDQVVDVVRFLRKFKSCELLLHDRTGVGDAIDDMLDTIPGLIYRGVVFSNASKAHMVNEYMTALEREEVHHAYWNASIHEHDVYEVSTNDLGVMTYSAPEGDHDDIVTSCFLGFQACEEHYTDNMEIKILEDLPKAEDEPDTIENFMYEQCDIDPEEGF